MTRSGFLPFATRRVRGAAAFLLLGHPAGAAGQEVAGRGPPPLVSDRPDFTESALTVPAGRLQAELGYTFARDGETHRHAIGELLLRIGLGDRLEGRLGVNSFVVLDGPGSRVDGFEDLSLGVKVSLARAESAGSAKPDLALLAGISLPTGHDAIGSKGAEPGIVLAAGWSLAERLSLAANAGWTLVRTDPDDVHELAGSVSLGAGLGARLGVFVEYFAFVPVSSGETNHFIDGGLTLLLRPELQLDGRIGIGVDGAGPETFAGVGLAARL